MHEDFGFVKGTFEGPSALFFTGLERGYYAASGLNVTIDSGKGSLDAIPKVASGTYPIGFADINSLVKFKDKNAGSKVIGIMMIYDAPPFAIIGRKSLGVSKPKDLEGKILGAPAPDGAFAQWKSFVLANGIDASKVTIENVGFPVREPMLAQGKVHAITGFSFSSYINLKSKGVPASDISLMLMTENGLDLYGNSVIVNTDYARKNPEVVKGFLNATLMGIRDVVADPGYGSTSKMIAESAICLVKQCPHLIGGIYTPAPAMGEKLIARLQANAGLDFRLEK